jgi:hypothetical protein
MASVSHTNKSAIVNYQCVVPNTWNAGPHDAEGQPSPYKASLADTPIAKPHQPLEILRTAHSFDPCMASRPVPPSVDRLKQAHCRSQAAPDKSSCLRRACAHDLLLSLTF